MIRPGWETVFFYGFGIVALFTGILVITARNSVHCALALVSSLISVAGLFVLVRAEFLAGVQVLVYVGGVMVLFLFVIMMVSVDRENTATTRLYTKQSGVAIAFTVLLAAAFMVAANLAKPHFADPDLAKRAAATDKASPGAAGLPISDNTEDVGLDLYSRAALPFEIASVVLLVAIVGSVLLARERKQEKVYE